MTTPPDTQRQREEVNKITPGNPRDLNEDGAHNDSIMVQTNLRSSCKKCGRISCYGGVGPDCLCHKCSLHRTWPAKPEFVDRKDHARYIQWSGKEMPQDGSPEAEELFELIERIEGQMSSGEEERRRRNDHKALRRALEADIGSHSPTGLTKRA